MYKPVGYRGPNTAENFHRDLQNEDERIKKEIFHTTPLKMSKQELQTYNNSTVCFVCDKPLNSDAVPDHRHITGQF